MDLSILKEPVIWLVSGLMAVFWSVTANLISPKVKAFISSLRQPKRVKNYEKNLANLNEILRLEEDKVLRYELKLEAIHLELVGVALYLISFATFFTVFFFEPVFLVIFMAVVVFVTGTKFIDTGVIMIKKAKLAAKRSREIADFARDNENELAIKKFKEDINVRDFGIKS